MTTVQAKKWRRWESNPREVPPNNARLTVPAFVAGVFPLAKWLAGALGTAALLLPAPTADGHVAGCHTRKCDRRIHQARVTRWLWRHYRSHPMPACTWVPESGPVARFAEYGRSRYRVRNTQSTAGGKYQILDSTWYAFGGHYYRDTHPAAVAPPLEQEKIARRVLRGQGVHAWVGC